MRRCDCNLTCWRLQPCITSLQPYVLEAATPRAPGAALRLIGSGSGGVTELASHLSQDNLFYGFVRTTEAIDSTVAVKFIFLSFIGENVPMMKKAKTSTLKGTITEAFEPFHAELLNASTLDEVI